MAKISVTMDFNFDGFDELNKDEKLDAIEEVLDSGAESTYSSIKVNSIAFLKED
jgi:hypothetical protein